MEAASEGPCSACSLINAPLISSTVLLQSSRRPAYSVSRPFVSITVKGSRSNDSTQMHQTIGDALVTTSTSTRNRQSEAPHTSNVHQCSHKLPGTDTNWQMITTARPRTFTHGEDGLLVVSDLLFVCFQGFRGLTAGHVRLQALISAG